METPRQLAPDHARYKSNVQVKSEPVDNPEMFLSSNRHYPQAVPRDPQRSLLPPEHGSSQPSRDPRKRHGEYLCQVYPSTRLFLFTASSVLPIKQERNLEGHNAEDEGERFFLLVIQSL